MILPVHFWHRDAQCTFYSRAYHIFSKDSLTFKIFRSLSLTMYCKFLKLFHSSLVIIRPSLYIFNFKVWQIVSFHNQDLHNHNNMTSRRPRRTRIYDTNYRIGESTYKSALDDIDRKYSIGRWVVKDTKTDTRTKKSVGCRHNPQFGKHPPWIFFF